MLRILSFHKFRRSNRGVALSWNWTFMKVQATIAPMVIPFKAESSWTFMKVQKVQWNFNESSMNICELSTIERFFVQIIFLHSRTCENSHQQHIQQQINHSPTSDWFPFQKHPSSIFNRFLRSIRISTIRPQTEC